MQSAEQTPFTDELILTTLNEIIKAHQDIDEIAADKLFFSMLQRTLLIDKQLDRIAQFEPRNLSKVNRQVRVLLDMNDS